jgi:hypothetical protein
MGFGLTEEGGNESPVLLETQVSYLSPATCTESQPEFLVNNDVMMCAYADDVDRYVTLG